MPNRLNENLINNVEDISVVLAFIGGAYALRRNELSIAGLAYLFLARQSKIYEMNEMIPKWDRSDFEEAMTDVNLSKFFCVSVSAVLVGLKMIDNLMLASGLIDNSFIEPSEEDIELEKGPVPFIISVFIGGLLSILFNLIKQEAIALKMLKDNNSLLIHYEVNFLNKDFFMNNVNSALAILEKNTRLVSISIESEIKITPLDLIKYRNMCKIVLPRNIENKKNTLALHIFSSVYSCDQIDLPFLSSDLIKEIMSYLIDDNKDKENNDTIKLADKRCLRECSFFPAKDPLIKPTQSEVRQHSMNLI